ELQLGIISDEDKASLIAWVQYIKALKAVDTSKAPDIIWPELPEA
ncbi:tail fiber assembly protein, partial [Escherichia coli]|nr:tail fiber assembly protein [Escherichia coli]